MAHGAVAPTMVYPLFETALRADAGRTIDEHQRHVSELWSRFAAVAADNPHAWSRTAYSPEEIRTVSPDNRMVCFPYPKRMCANIDVDQGAAVLLCSYEAARRAGVPDDRMVFLHAAAEAHDHWFVTERGSLAESPAIAAAAADALAARGDRRRRHRALRPLLVLPVGGARSRATRSASRRDPRPLTVTGGLGFAGGPVNNYPTHGIARMVERLPRRSRRVRADDRARLVRHEARGRGLVGAAAAAGFRRVDPETTQAQVDALPAARPPGSSTATSRRGDVGRVRARRRAVAAAS